MRKLINKKILIPLLIFFLLFSILALGTPNFVDVGPDTDFQGDVGVPADGAYYIGENRLDMGVLSEWTFTHLEDQLFFGEFAKIEYVRYTNFEATSAPTVNDDTDLGYVIGSLWYDATADKGYANLDNTDGAAVWIETTSLGHTNLTSFVDQTAWRVFYSNTDGDVIELALGTSGKYLKSTGTTSAPEFDTPPSYTNLTSFVDQTAWRLFYSNTDGDVVELALGDDGKFLMSNGPAVAPTWELVTGETNTASNVGAQVEIFKQKAGVDLEFRTLYAETNKIKVSITGESIDVGAAAIDRTGSATITFTLIFFDNPIEDTGTITKVEIWANTEMSNVEVGIFYLVSGSNYSTRSNATLGTVVAGSKQTFDVSLAAQSGDYIGIYLTAGKLEETASGGLGTYYKTGDNIPCTNETFSFNENSHSYSLYGYSVPVDLNYVVFDIQEENIKLDDLGAPDDNTDNDASTSAHGLMPKLPNVATQFIDGTGAWNTLAVGDLPSMTSSEFAGVISDETGTLKLVYSDSPVFTTKITTPIIDLTGGQIAFPATQVPSAGANTIDDYKEGEWTPVLEFGGASVDMTYTTQAGLYTKIGRQVTITSYINLSNKGTSTGNALIEGLPFTSKNNNGAYSVVSLRLINVTFTHIFEGYIAKNDTKINLREVTEAGSESYLTDADFANDSIIMATVTYFTD